MINYENLGKRDVFSPLGTWQQKDAQNPTRI